MDVTGQLSAASDACRLRKEDLSPKVRLLFIEKDANEFLPPGLLRRHYLPDAKSRQQAEDA